MNNHFNRSQVYYLTLLCFSLLPHLVVADEGEMAIIKFNGLQECYDISDTVRVNLVEKVPSNRTEKIDLWFAIATHTGEMLFMTPNHLSDLELPFKTAVNTTETSHRLLDDFEVHPDLEGQYTLYALYVETGKNPLHDFANVRQSNLVCKNTYIWDVFISESTIPSLSPTEHTKYNFIYNGIPVSKNYPNSIRYLDRLGYIVGYDEIRKNPAWVAYKVGPIKFKCERPKGKLDTDTDTWAQVTYDDYTHSGFDRGHMAPNHAIATRYGCQAQKQTFLMSNIVPQNPDLNQGPWKKLENIVAGDNKYDSLADMFGEIWVVTGPIYNDQPEFIPTVCIEIPKQFYKIIVYEMDGFPRMLGFVMPQKVESRTEEIVQYLTSVDKIEELTGLDFFVNLEDSLEEKVEAEVQNQIWE